MSFMRSFDVSKLNSVELSTQRPKKNYKKTYKMRFGKKVLFSGQYGSLEFLW